jgi:hypothetical protein
MARRFPLEATHVTACARITIQESALGLDAGLGAFATEDMAVGETLGRYAGEWLTRAQLDARYGGDDAVAPYALTLMCCDARDCGRRQSRGVHAPHRVIVDAADERMGNWTRYVNDGPHSGRPANVSFNSQGYLVVVQPIRAGDELYVDYGPEYWRLPGRS